MHDVNDTIYQYFFRPLAKGYRAVVPEEGRIAVGNAFDNLKAPAKLVSSAIQGDADKSGRVVSRFLINSTVGMGGFLDVAEQEYGIHNVDEDFSQALASQGVSQGDYLVLPVFGPSTTRDAVGMVVDSALNPASYFGIGFLANAALNTSERVNRTSFIVDDIDQLNESAIDPYESQRHFYLEIREKQTNE
jgi:phospholipid-binding lipoprotein MlaA